MKTQILDGEIANSIESSPPLFQWLGSCPKDGPATTPVCIAFDVLEVDGGDLCSKAVRERRRMLSCGVEPPDDIPCSAPVPRVRGVRRRGGGAYEVIVAKDNDSLYSGGTHREVAQDQAAGLPH